VTTLLMFFIISDNHNRTSSLEVEVESAHDKADTLTRRTTELVR